MMQELFRIPGLDIPVFGYGLMLVIGFYSAMQVGRALARRCGIDPDFIVNIALIALLFGVAGSRLSHVLENLGEYTRADRSAWENFVAAINIRSGGLTFFGGLLLAAGACVIYTVWRKVPLRTAMDVLAPCVMIGLGFGRVGCFLNGCCYGAACDLPWAVHFPYDSNAYRDQFQHNRLNLPPELLTQDAKGFTRLKSATAAKQDPQTAALLRQNIPGVTRALPVHPSQLYSTFNAFLIAGMLIAFITMRPPPGRVFALMLIAMGLTRFLLEMIRAEPTVFGPLSFSMVLSIPLFFGGLAMWWIVGRMNPQWPAFEYPSPPAAAPV